MRPPLKLSDIDREHLQELYDAVGVPRDRLPYTESFEQIWQGFQDRTFKNADREQVYAALLKHVRVGNRVAEDLPPSPLNDEQLKQLKIILARTVRQGKLMPYSDEFDIARREFNTTAGLELSELEFWHAVLRAQGPKRLPPRRAKAATPKPDDDDDE